MRFESTAQEDMNRIATDVVECPECGSESISVMTVPVDDCIFECDECEHTFEVMG